MSNQHRSVTDDDRRQILALAQQGIQKKTIARIIDRHRDTVARVLKTAGWGKVPPPADPPVSVALTPPSAPPDTTPEPQPDEEPTSKRKPKPPTIEEQLATVLDHVRAIPAPVAIEGGYREPAEGVWLCDISDVHAGQKVPVEDVGSVSEYNTDIFYRRLDNLFHHIKAIVDVQRRGETKPLDTLYLNFLGDMCDGEVVYLSQGRDIDCDALAQVTELSDRWATRFIPALLDQGGFQHIKCFCVIGNHGRIGHKGEAHFRSNLDAFLYRMMELRLANDPRVEFHISASPWMEYALFGRIHHLEHGDAMKSALGVPWYGLSRLPGLVSQMTGVIPWAFHVGHFHTAAHLDMPGGGFLSCNGSFPGGSDLSVNRMHKAGRPCQILRLLNPERLVATWMVELDEKMLLDPSTDGCLTPTLKPLPPL